MKTIKTEGITDIHLIPYGTDEWYYGISHEHGDLYEAEEIFKAGHEVEGRKLILIHYPDGEVYQPLPKQSGVYPAEPVCYEGDIYIPSVDFPKGLIRILKFNCDNKETITLEELPLSRVKDCYNLRLDIAPLTLTRQCVWTNEFEILWPERVCFSMGDHDSFFLREGDKLYFSRWHEEGEGKDYRYWEETVVRSLEGEITEILVGDVRIMPNGEMWHLG